MKKLILEPLFILLITAAAATTAGKGTISCLMDGKQKSFSPQQSFFEIRLDVDTKGPTDAIEILDGSPKQEGFQFEFKKSGTTKIKTLSGDMNCIINYYNAAGITYTGRDITINVTSYDQNHLIATFSGKLGKLRYQKTSDQSPDVITLTNGKIDMIR